MPALLTPRRRFRYRHIAVSEYRLPPHRFASSPSVATLTLVAAAASNMASHMLTHSFLFLRQPAPARPPPRHELRFHAASRYRHAAAIATICRS